MVQPTRSPIRIRPYGISYLTVMAGLTCGLLLGVAAASAQQLDYGKYESLFGESVTMSATGKPERVSDTPVLMDIITAQDIERSGARDIPTLLRRLAGINLIHSSGSSVEYGIDGYLQTVGSRVMVLINGRQIYFDGFGDVFWETVPVELQEIRQIEVIHGAQSALYGFNAVDGVINIVTYDPVDDPVNAATVRLGNHARRDGSASVTQSLGEGNGVRITASLDHARDFGIVPTAPNDANFQKDPDRRAASFDAGFTLPDGARLGFEGSHSDIDERAVTFDSFYNTRIVVDSVKASYVANTGIGHVNGTVYFMNMQVPWIQNAVLQSFNVADRSTVAQVSDLFKMGPSDSFRVGVEARRDELASDTLVYGTLSGDLGAGSAMWEHQFSPNFSSVNALRYDYFMLDRTGQPLPLNLYANSEFDRSVQGTSLNSALIDKVSEADALRLSFARGLKLPSLGDFGQVEQFRDNPIFPAIYHFGNPHLLPSVVYDYRTGWDHQFAALDATTGVSIFHQMTMHHIGTPTALLFQSNQPVIVQESAMAGGSVDNGVEWRLQHKTREGWNWGVNYTLQHLHEHENLALLDFRDGEPRHTANANIGYAWGSWDAELFAGYASATTGTIINAVVFPPAQTTVTVKGFATLSPRLAWRAADWVRVELVADSLWPYRDSAVQRMDPSYYLSVKFTY